MSGYTEIVNTLKEIRNFLQSKMTPQFMNSVQGAADAIQQTLGDPNLQANIRASLEQLRILLENANTTDLVGQLSGMAGDIRTILQSIDPQQVSNIINSLNNLITAADKAELIQNIMKALDSVTCLKDLVNVAKELALPAKVLMYGATGALIGIGLTTAIQTYLKNKADKQLQEYLDKLIAINTQQLYVQIQQLRVLAGQYLLSIEVKEQERPNFILSERLTRLRNEQMLILDVLSPIDIDSLELLEKAQEFGQAMLEKLYQPQLDNESVTDYLDRINSNPLNRGALVKFVAYSPQYRMWGQVDKPPLPRDELNYLQIKKLYGNDVINKMMLNLVESFSKNGGEDIFLGLANSFENTAHVLYQCIADIYEQGADFVFSESPWSNGANRLLQNYHQANQDLIHQWNNVEWSLIGLNPAHHVDAKILNIIRDRALAEFCHRTAPRLCFPRNLPREVINGALDVPLGIYQLVTTNPVTTATNLWNTVFTSNGRQSFFARIYCHPARAIANTAVSYGISAGANSLFSSAPKVSYTRNMLANSSSIHSPYTSSTSLVVKEGAVLTTGTLAQQKSSATATENNQEHVELEMSMPREKPPSMVTSELSSELIESLSSAKKIDDFYEAIFQWYKKVDSSIEKPISESFKKGAGLTFQEGYQASMRRDKQKDFEESDQFLAKKTL